MPVEGVLVEVIEKEKKIIQFHLTLFLFFFLSFPELLYSKTYIPHQLISCKPYITKYIFHATG